MLVTCATGDSTATVTATATDIGRVGGAEMVGEGRVVGWVMGCVVGGSTGTPISVVAVTTAVTFAISGGKLGVAVG